MATTGARDRCRALTILPHNPWIGRREVVKPPALMGLIHRRSDTSARSHPVQANRREFGG